MPPKPPLTPFPDNDLTDTNPDPTDDAVPIDDIKGDALPPTDPPVDTALDDDEGGADAIDPETGLPYDNKDTGVSIPAAKRDGGSRET